MSIAVIAGLGNPGPKYRETRHNIGFAVVEHFARQLTPAARWETLTRFEASVLRTQWAGRPLLLVKPLTFMNESGRALGHVLRAHGLEASQCLVVYDDITLELGRPKLRIDGGAGGHNGIRDLLGRIGPGFARYRIGIGAKPDKAMSLADYVLQRFKPAEQEQIKAALPLYADHLRLIVDKGLEPALNEINRRKRGPDQSDVADNAAQRSSIAPADAEGQPNPASGGRSEAPPGSISTGHRPNHRHDDPKGLSNNHSHDASE